jgi:hypothetical protein
LVEELRNLRMLGEIAREESMLAVGVELETGTARAEGLARSFTDPRRLPQDRSPTHSELGRRGATVIWGEL